MSLISEFLATAARTPAKIALITERSQMSYSDLADLVQAFDIALMTQGVRPGHRIVAATSRPEYCIALALLVSLRSLTVIFSSPSVVAANGLEIDRVVTDDTDLSASGGRVLTIAQDWFLPMGSLPPLRPAEGSGRGTFVFQSSGSTGRPKLIAGPETDRADRMHARGAFGEVDLSERRVASALGIRTGWTMGLALSVLTVGGSLLLLDHERDRLLPYLDLYAVDTLATAVGSLRQALDLANPGQYLRSLRDIRISGALVGTELLAAVERVSAARLHVGYGTAETGNVARRVVSSAHHPGTGFVGDIIRADLDVVFHDETLRPLPGATEGVIGFRPRSGELLRSYLGEAASGGAEGFIDGTFFPGDIGRREGDALFITGRVKNIVNMGGNKLSLEVVEQALETAFPGTRFAALASLDAGRGEGLALAYSGSREVSVQGALSALGRLKANVIVHRTERLPALPLTATGKTDRPALRRDLGLEPK